jgi:hypothetical protein
MLDVKGIKRVIKYYLFIFAFEKQYNNTYVFKHDQKFHSFIPDDRCSVVIMPV